MNDAVHELAHVSIGKLAERMGVSKSALRLYEKQGLIKAIYTHGGHRRYPADTKLSDILKPKEDWQETEGGTDAQT